MTDEEKKELEFAHTTAKEAITAFFEQKTKIRELYKRIAELESKEEKEMARLIKAERFEAEKIAIERCCEVFDDTIGFHAYEVTDRIRKSYKIPAKYGF